MLVYSMVRAVEEELKIVDSIISNFEKTKSETNDFLIASSFKDMSPLLNFQNPLTETERTGDTDLVVGSRCLVRYKPAQMCPAAYSYSCEADTEMSG